MPKQPPAYDQLYRELIATLYDVRWDETDAAMPTEILGRMWQPKLERDVMLINRWVTLLTFYMYAKPEAFDEALHAVGLQVRQLLLKTRAYAEPEPGYLRISHPRVQAERHFFLLTRGWADELRVVSPAARSAAEQDAAKQQLLEARSKLGRVLMNYSTVAIITEAVLATPSGAPEDSHVAVWLAKPKEVRALFQHMRNLKALHELLQPLPVFAQLQKEHLDGYFDAGRSKVPPFFTTTTLPELP
jgi:hypothetical protein